MLASNNNQGVAMISTSSALLLFTLLTPYSVRAANDWSVPCVSGGCSWDTGDGKNTAYSSMAIGGRNDLISDLTPAAGWKISGCDSDWNAGPHTIQLTCTDQNAYCGHLYEGGAQHTIVRLPENCGKGPFARVVAATNNTGSLSKRAANSSAIEDTHTITLDYNFHQVPTSRGKVTFAVTATNLEGLPGVSKRDLDVLRGRGRAKDIHRKRFAQLKDFRRGFGDIIKGAEDAAHDAGDAIADGASIVTSAAGSAASAVGSAISDANSFDKTLSTGKLTPISFDKDIVLFDQSIACKAGDFSANAEFKIDVDGKVEATVEFGVTVVGTIVPPKIDDFSVTADLGGSTTATFTVDAKAEGKFDTSPIELFRFGLPGLSIPSILTLGPEFSISAEVIVDLKSEAKLAIQAAWEFPNVKLIFPPEKGTSTGDATVTNTNQPIQLSADPSFDVSASVSAHIIPRVDFGIDFFDGADQASIFVDADISATLSAEINAKAELNNKDSTTSATSVVATSAVSNATQVATGAAGATSLSDVTTTGAVASSSPTSLAVVATSTNIPSSVEVPPTTTAPVSVTNTLAVITNATTISAPANISQPTTSATAAPISVTNTLAVITNATRISVPADVSQPATSPTAAPISVTNTLAVITNATKISTGPNVSQTQIRNTTATVPVHVSKSTIISLATSAKPTTTAAVSKEPQTSKSISDKPTSAGISPPIAVSSSAPHTSADATNSLGSGGDRIASSTADSAAPVTSAANATSSAHLGVATTVAFSKSDALQTSKSPNEKVSSASPVSSSSPGSSSAAHANAGSAVSQTVGTGKIVPITETGIITATRTTVPATPTAIQGTTNSTSPTTNVTGISVSLANSTASSSVDVSTTGNVLVASPIVTSAISVTTPIKSGDQGSTAIPTIGGVLGGTSSATSEMAAAPTNTTSGAPRPRLRCRPKSSPFNKGRSNSARDLTRVARGENRSEVEVGFPSLSPTNRRSSGVGRRDTSASTTECITLSAGIAINAGLHGSLEPLIDKKEISFKIFSKDIPIFQRCNGTPKPAAKLKRSGIPARRADTSGLQCPIQGLASVLESLI